MLVLAALLRLIGLDKPLYIDEIVTITVATQSLDRMGAAMRQIDASPVMFPLLLHGWIAVSRSDAWVRLLPAIFGIASVLVCALLVRRTFGWRAGLASAFVMAIAPAHIHYSQYVRGYSLLTLLVGLHLLLFVRWLETRARSRWQLPVIALVTSALLYTHYLSLLLFAAEGLYVLYGLLRWPDLRRALLQWTTAGVLGAICFLPGLPLLLHNVEYDRIRNVERPLPPPAWEVVPNLVAELSVGQRILGFDDPALRRTTLGVAAVIFPVLAVIGAVGAVRHSPRGLALLGLVTVLPLLVYIGTGRRLIAVRFFVPFAFGYVGSIGAGLASLRRRHALVMAIMLVCVSAVPLEHYYRDFQWSYDHRTVARALERQIEPGDAVLVMHPFEAFFYRWYLGAEIPIRGLVFTALEDQAGYVIKPPPLRLDRAMPRILDAADSYERLWVIGGSPRSFATDQLHEARIFEWLDARFLRRTELNDVTSGAPTIRLYEVPRPKEPM